MNPWTRSPFPQDLAQANDFTEGSKKLLMALWREHPERMRLVGAQRP